VRLALLAVMIVLGCQAWVAAPGPAAAGADDLRTMPLPRPHASGPGRSIAGLPAPCEERKNPCVPPRGDGQEMPEDVERTARALLLAALTPAMPLLAPILLHAGICPAEDGCPL